MNKNKYLAILGGLVVTGVANAQQYPSRPIRIIVQFTPGTSTDVMARVAAQRLSATFNQQVLIDNRPGAGAVLGTDIAAKATPDGHTLVAAVSSAFGINPTLYTRIPYDAVKDFDPIINLALTPQTLVANTSAPFKNIKELVAYAREKPGAVNYASLGAGSTSHLTTEMFRSAAGIKLNHIPFKGSGDAHTQLMGGQIPIMHDAIPATLPHIKSGKLRALAITSAKRSPLLPEVPTMAEAGLPRLEFTQWFGVVGPAGLPADVVKKLNAAINAILESAETKSKLMALGADPLGGSAADFAAVIKADTSRFGKLIQEANIKLE